MTDQDNDNGKHPLPAELLNAQNSMLDGLSQLADYLGFSKVMGQLYAALLFSPGPLSLDDLMAHLSISKASVSMNLRTLEHMGMVRQVWLRGKSGRRKYYEAETDYVQIITNILSGREMRDVDRALSVLHGNAEVIKVARDKMDADSQQVADLYLERINQMESMFRFAQLVITSILERVAGVDLNDISRIEIE